MSKKAKLPDREWSYPIIADEVPSAGKAYELVPSDAERKAIAKRLGIVSLDELKAQVTLERDGGHVIKASGELAARVTQSCVVSLEPVESDIDDVFEAWYADHDEVASFRRAQHDALNKKEMADLPMLEEHEDPEPIENGQIDLGELVTQYLSLSINPYPQKEGVEYANKETERPVPEPDRLRPNPFAALKNWRPKD